MILENAERIEQVRFGRKPTQLTIAVTNYIRHHMLRYSDKSFTTIGSYLGFSSLGHFSLVFKKYVGRTPGKYRDRYAK